MTRGGECTTHSTRSRRGSTASRRTAYVGDTHHLEAKQSHDDDGGSCAWPSTERTRASRRREHPTSHPRRSVPQSFAWRLRRRCRATTRSASVEPGTEIASIRIGPADGVSRRDLV